MGIDRWKQEHRNWRPGGVRLVVPEMQPDEPSEEILSEKTSIPKPRVAKKQAAPASDSADRPSDNVQPKRSKR
jgi:hypothetical protein